MGDYTATERKRRQRARARAAGLCIVCASSAPQPGLTTCAPCDTAARDRQKKLAKPS